MPCAISESHCTDDGSQSLPAPLIHAACSQRREGWAQGLGSVVGVWPVSKRLRRQTRWSLSKCEHRQAEVPREYHRHCNQPVCSRRFQASRGELPGARRMTPIRPRITAQGDDGPCWRAAATATAQNASLLRASVAPGARWRLIAHARCCPSAPR